MPTLFEKAARLVMVRLGSNLPPPVTVAEDAERVARLLERCPLGGLVLFNGTLRDTPGVLAGLQARSRTPLLVATDMERGVGQQVRGATVFPHAMAFSRLGEEAEEAVEETARVAAREALACGIHITFAPVADVNLDPRNPIIATRAFGSDPETAARLAAAYVRGARAEGLLTTAKHFPGHGNTAADSHAELPVVRSDRATWARTDAVPFRAVLAAGVDLVMTAHVAYPALDPSGAPATASPRILCDLLRREMGFTGVVVTDSLLMGAIRARPDAVGAQAAALVRAGVDLLLDVPDAEAAVAGLVRAVEEGTLPEARLDEACGRVERLRQQLVNRFGPDVFTHPPAAPVGSPDHRTLADDVARRALTVLKASGPLPPETGGDGLLVVLLRPHTSHLDPPEAPLGTMVRTALPRAVYAELGPDARPAVFDRVMTEALAARRVVAALVVKPAAWHAFGLRPEQQRFVERLVARRPVDLVALGSPLPLESFPTAPVHACTYSDVEPSQRALVHFLREGFSSVPR
ncbi:MAG: beta-N-acetylhexosaminidase [Rhodothermaceae bacterium]|nr:MAG: beta-N-acetylhexosaminidase [Rhodothermaceae bacterium]